MGMKSLINNPAHRQELVAGHHAEYFIKGVFGDCSLAQRAHFPASPEYKDAILSAGPHAAGFQKTRQDYFIRSSSGLSSFLQEPLKELPQIAFTLRALQKPASAPVTLASLQLVRQTLETCSQQLLLLWFRTGSISDLLASLRKVYDVEKIENKVPDGTTPFPEDARSLKHGIRVEFR